MNPGATQPELHELINAACCDELSDDQLPRLEALVCESDSARHEYLRAFEMATTIRFCVKTSRAAQQAIDRVEAAIAAAPETPQTHRSPILGFLGTAVSVSAAWLSSPKVLAITVMGGLATYFVGLMISIAISRAFLSDRHAQQSAEPPAAAPARIVAASGCQWQDRAPRADLESLLPAGTSRLTAGVVELEFDDGARVSIQGPAEFTPRSGHAIELVRGRLVAYVPRQARGFTVATPTAEIIDLGTEFDVAVNDGNTELHVLRGVVEIKPSPAAIVSKRSGQKVVAGQSARATREGVSFPLATPESPAELARQEPPRPAAPQQRDVLDMVDLLAGGNGRGQRRGISIDPCSGRYGDLETAQEMRLGDGAYHLCSSHSIVDGSFVPNGLLQIDSTGHRFEFPKTDGGGVSHIWAGRTVPVAARWAQRLGDIDYAEAGHALLFLSANKGLTVDLAAVRRLDTGKRIVGLEAVAGNSVPQDALGLPKFIDSPPRADFFVLVDGELRFERRGFTPADGPFSVRVPLREGDRFLTLAATDGGDSFYGDWVMLGDPRWNFTNCEQSPCRSSPAIVLVGVASISLSKVMSLLSGARP